MTMRLYAKDVNDAAEAWGFNCGPGALCAVLDMTPAEIRPHLLDFESKGYSNPTLVKGVLTGLGVKWSEFYRSDEPSGCPDIYPLLSLVRVQWGGSWTRPGVPMRVRYRKTHWVAVRRQLSIPVLPQVFDVNAIHVGGWLDWDQWEKNLVPWIIKNLVEGGDGTWWPTHVLQVTPK